MIKTLDGDIDVAILGIGNHRVPNYELPSNIPGLTFSDPIAKTQQLSDLFRPTNDVLIALTHIGFTENPASVEVDANVDTNLVANVSGFDALGWWRTATRILQPDSGCINTYPASLRFEWKTSDCQPGIPL